MRPWSSATWPRWHRSSVRRLLAYSAIAHAGYILLGLAFFSWTNASAQAILYYILTYGLTTIGAFGVVGVVERATGSDKLDSFLGLQKRNPLLAAVLLVLFLSLAGIPPLVGFWAKFNLFAAVLAAGTGPVPFALVALAIAFSAVSLYYYLQVLKRAYVMPAADDSPIKAHPVTLTVLLLIAAAVVVFGCFPALAARLDRQLLRVAQRSGGLETHRDSRSGDRRYNLRLTILTPPTPLAPLTPPLFQYFTIAANESGLRLAPPTSAPSISSWPISAVALSGFTLPP